VKIAKVFLHVAQDLLDLRFSLLPSGTVHHLFEFLSELDDSLRTSIYSDKGMVSSSDVENESGRDGVADLRKLSFPDDTGSFVGSRSELVISLSTRFRFGGGRGEGGGSGGSGESGLGENETQR
jgi:hypothetical protein